MVSHISSFSSRAVREFHVHMMLAEERHKLSIGSLPVSRQNFWKASTLFELLKSAFPNATFQLCLQASMWKVIFNL